jgi:ssDNA-binding replication factor A large subunit
MNIEDTIKRIIEHTGLSREEIKAEIDKQIQKLSNLIDEEAALIIVAKTLGVDLKEQQEEANLEKDQPIGGLKANSSASVIGRVVEISALRNYNKKDGGQGSLVPFLLEDNSGLIRAIIWDQNTQVLNETGFAKNQVIRIVNALVKESKMGGLELHIGNKSRIQIDPDNLDAKMVPSLKNRKIQFTPLDKISTNSPILHIEGVVTNIFSPKAFESKTGKSGTRSSITISKDNNNAYIVFWNDDTKKMETLQAGQLITITNLRPKKNFKDPTKIDLTATTESEITIMGTSENIAAVSKIPLQMRKISEVNDNLGFGNLEAKIMDIQNVRTVSLKDGTKKNVQNLTIADETASMELNLWGEQINADLKIGEVVYIQNFRAKKNAYSGLTELTLSRDGKMEPINKVINSIKVNPQDKTINSINSAENSNQSNSISEIKDITEPKFVSYKASIIKDIRQITIYEGCASCYRKPENCTCNPKGVLVPRIIVNLLTEDESGTIRTALIGDLAEKFLQTKAEEVKELKQKNQLDDFLKSKNKELQGKEFIFRGRAKYSNYSENYEINANSFEPIDTLNEISDILEIIDN